MAVGELLDGLHRRLYGSMFGDMDSRMHGWVMEQAREGDRLNQADPLYSQMDVNMRYVSGEQYTGRRPPGFVPNIVINETGRTCRIHASALTDIKPLFAWRVSNPKFGDAASALNQMLINWWVSRFIDLALCDVIKYGLAVGSGDGMLEFDASLPGGGDSVLLPRDPRDTLPIRPSHSTRIQDWGGAVFRQEVDPGKLMALYPTKIASITAASSSSSRLGPVLTRFIRSVLTPSGTLDGLSRQKTGPDLTAAGIQTYNAHFKDPSINKSTVAVLVGPPGSNFSYLVQPGKPLYPRGRLCVCTVNDTLYDGPNPYWHGMIPAMRFSPDPWPWSFYGNPPAGAMRPLQDAMNMAVNFLMSNLSQHVRRGTQWDKNASDAVVKAFNPEEPYWKVKYNMQYGEMFKLADVAEVPAWGMPFIQFLFDKFQEIGETQNYQQLLQLRQVPSGDTMERYQNAMTPGIRMEGRYLEYFLRDMAHMLLCNIFQFFSAKRRYSLIGDAGLVLADVDWDPDTMIPGMSPGDPDYTEELDKSRPRDERAQFFKGLFTFYVAPNSLLAMNAQEQKILYLQLYRMQLVDPWTLLEKLEIPNAGSPPPTMLPIPGAPPVSQPVIDPATGIQQVDPATGQPATQMVPPTSMRIPITITERIIAAAQMGIGAQPSAAGRPPSGGAMPAVEQKSGGRTTVTESKK